MKRLSAVALSSLLLSTVLASSQPAPFDMTPERGEAPVAPAAPAQPAPAQAAPDQPARTLPARPITPTPVRPAAPAEAVAPPAPAQGVEEASGARRYVIPFEELVLSGEIDRRSWGLHLTASEAANATTFHLGYQNAIVVAPEASRLRVLVNGAVLVDEPVSAPETLVERAVPIPAGLLRVGSNTVVMEAFQRHRTDCTVQSTYELWSEIAPDRTFLSFGDSQAPRFARPDDVAAIGADARGRTRINLIVPGIESRAAAAPLLRLAEGLAVSAGMPNQSVSVLPAADGPAGPGEINVVMGLPADIDRILDTVPAGAAVSPTVAFVDDPATGPSTMVVSGPTWPLVAAAVDTVVAPVDRPISTDRATLTTQGWRLPEPPLFLGAGSRSLAELGQTTTEFSGRRFRADFTIGIPSDFYAENYGEARLLLDAAYTPDVLAGSHIDIYVNGEIAATVPITSGGGAILRQLPVPVTMRHFRPGENTIAIETILRTRADETCAPGVAKDGAARFVLFDTSRFVMPRFARIAQRPNLAGTAGTGFPYNRATQPVPVMIEGGAEALSAAATVLSRMSVSAGRPIPVEPVASAGMIGGRDALFFGPVVNFQPELLAQVGLAPDARISWGAGGTNLAQSDDALRTSATFDRWRNELSGSGWRGQIGSFDQWLSRNFDITTSSLRLTPRAEPVLTPADNVSLVMAQRPGPNETGTWTMVTAPTVQGLREGAEAFVGLDNWRKVAGGMALFDAPAGTTESRSAGIYRFIETQPASLANYRLIASNWLSGNVLSFAAALFVICLLLGISTAALLHNLGRRR